VLLVLLGTALSGMSLDEAESALQNSEKSEIFRAYDTFKSSYIQAQLSGDPVLKRRALEGIVTSGGLLHIDVNTYKKKLDKLPQVTPAKAEAVQTIPLQIEPTQTVAPEAEKIVAAPSEKTAVHTMNGETHLKNVRWEEGDLVLIFDNTLDDKDIKFFQLKKTEKKGYRYVFDIHAVLDKSRTLTHRDLKRITLAQYKPATIRLVLESDQKLPLRFTKTEKSVIISGSLSHVTSAKPVKVTIPSVALQGEGRTVVIDPGHGGKDCGAVGYKRYQEKEVVLAIASKTAELLRARGYTVYMTRSTDRFIKLRNRTHFANLKKADLFISVHANAVPKSKAEHAYGLETYFLSPSRSKRAANAAAMENQTEVEDMNFYAKNVFLNALNSEKIVASHKLAIDLQSNILSSLRARYDNVKDSGVREGPFWVLVGAQMPAVLVEVGFITHPNEGLRLKSESYQDYFARGLADGVGEYFAKNR